jgi:hypothetical protein
MYAAQCYKNLRRCAVAEPQLQTFFIFEKKMPHVHMLPPFSFK